MSDLLNEGQFAALMRRFDELIAEAGRLSQEIADAMRRDREEPFWPDRRRHSQPHHPERRAGRNIKG